MLNEQAPSPLAGALDAARRGWRVIRLQPAGKVPAGKWRGLETSDPGIVTAWWGRGEDPNYGIVADASGLVILDEDEHGALDAWQAVHGVTLPETFTVTSGRGRHLYFRADEHDYSNSSPFTAEGYAVDVRAHGYVVGPGSVHGDTGAVYTVTDPRTPVLVPAALRDYLTAPAVRAVERTEAARAVTAPPVADRWLGAAVAGVLSDLAACQGTPPGAEPRWDRATYAAARRLVELVNGSDGALALEQARAEFMAAAPTDARFGAEQHAHKWDDAVRAGGVAERPERPAPVTLAEEFGLTPPPLAHPEPAPAVVPDGPAPDRFAPLDWGDVLNGPPPAEEWVLWPLAERGQSVSLYSAPKVGKSLLMLDMLAHACSGRPVLGRRPAAPLRVLYLDAENTRKDLRKRLHDMGADPSTLEHLVYLSFPPLAPLDTARGAAELHALVDQHRPDLVVIDTVSRFIDGPENDADTWLNVYRLTLAPLKARQVAVIRLDHAGKDAERGERGSSAKNGDVDVSWQLAYDEHRGTRTLTRKLTRTGNGPERLVLNIEEGPLRHEPASPLDSSADPVSHLVRKLDELDADAGIGFKLAGPLLRDNGHGGFRNDLLREALRVRKARKGDPEGDPEASEMTPSGSPSEGDPTPGSPQHETPGQRVTPPSGSPRVTLSPDLGDPGTPHPMGVPVGSPSQMKGSPPPCEGCGEPLAEAITADGFTTHPACERGQA